jgi:ABC-type Fe3+ transport system substrate-binding protein
MRDQQVPINDLYSFALQQLKEVQQPVNVHFTEHGSTMLAQRVAAVIESSLPSKPQ